MGPCALPFPGVGAYGDPSHGAASPQRAPAARGRRGHHLSPSDRAAAPAVLRRRAPERSAHARSAGAGPGGARVCARRGHAGAPAADRERAGRSPARRYGGVAAGWPPPRRGEHPAPRPARRHRRAESQGLRRHPVVVSGFEIVALAASAGGLKALTEVLAALPRDFPAALVVVQHLDPRHRSLMAEILGRRTALLIKEAREGDALERGLALIAPPNRHLLVNPDRTVSLSQSELVHFVRPSADLLFESTAASYKERAIAVVLTGSGRDGAMGVKAIKKMGGTVIVQDEKTAEFFGMPGAAQQTGLVDFILPLAEIAPALRTLLAGAAA